MNIELIIFILLTVLMGSACWRACTTADTGWLLMWILMLIPWFGFTMYGTMETNEIYVTYSEASVTPVGNTLAITDGVDTIMDDSVRLLDNPVSLKRYKRATLFGYCDGTVYVEALLTSEIKPTTTQ